MAGKNKIKPLFDNVLIKPLEAEEKTPSGIILPDSAKKNHKSEKLWQWGPVLQLMTGN